MEIVKSTDRYLTIADKNHQCLWGSLFAAPFLAIGLGVGAATIKVVTLECQRNESQQVDCQRTISGILSSEIDRLQSLRTATVVKTSGIGIVLETQAGKVELAPYRTFVMDGHYRNVDRLNSFIQNSHQKKIRIDRDDRLINVLWSGNFAIAGVLILLFALAIPMKVTCQIDRQIDRITIDKKYWLYGNHQKIISLSNLDRVELTKFPYAVNHQPLYNITFIPIEGKKVSLSVPGTNLSAYQQIIDAANNFRSRSRTNS